MPSHPGHTVTSTHAAVPGSRPPDVPERPRQQPDAQAAINDDAALMRRVGKGDVAAFEAVVVRYWAEIKLYVLHLAHDPDLAEDIAQEAFAQLWRIRARWVGRGSVRMWLLRSARNAFFSDCRKRQVRDAWAQRAEGRPRPVAPTPLMQAEQAELRGAIREAVDQLSPRRREAFSLVHLQGLSYRQAAGIMEVREQTVANDLQAAIGELREALEDFGREFRED